MRKPEQIIENIIDKDRGKEFPDTTFNAYDGAGGTSRYLREDLAVIAIQLAQKEAYNEAIKEAANSAKYTYYMFKFQNGIKYIDSETLSIDKESILNLLKP